MIVVLQDDNTVSLYESVEDLVADIEALDADAIAAAYDDTGRKLRVSWIRPNHYGRKLLGLQSVMPGEYTLVQEGEPEPGALLRVLRSRADSAPPAIQSQIEKLMAELERIV